MVGTIATLPAAALVLEIVVEVELFDIELVEGAATTLPGAMDVEVEVVFTEVVEGVETALVVVPATTATEPPNACLAICA